MCIHICILCCIHIYIYIYIYNVYPYMYIMLYTSYIYIYYIILCCIHINMYVYIYWICLQNRKPRYLKSLPRRNWQDLEPRRVRCSLCDIGEMDSLIIPAVNVSQLQWTVYVFCGGEFWRGSDIGHEPWAMYFCWIYWMGCPKSPKCFIPKSAAVTPPALGGLHQKRLRCRRSPKPTFKTSILVKSYQPDICTL